MTTKIKTGKMCKICGGKEFASSTVTMLESVVDGDGKFVRFLDTDLEAAKEATYTGPFTCLNCGNRGNKLEDLTTDLTMRLFEKPVDEGLTGEEILCMIREMGTKDVLLVEFPAKAHECSAMGFIDMEYVSSLSEEDHEALGDYIAWILDDMNNEHETGLYTYRGATIKLTR